MTGYLVGCCRSVRTPLASSRWRKCDWSRFVTPVSTPQTCNHPPRLFSSTSEELDDLTHKKKSKRQQFKESPVHPSIRRYIEMIGVGIPSRRKGSKRLRNHLFDHLEEGNRYSSPFTTQPPPPFASSTGDRRVVVIGSVSGIKDTLPTNKEMVPEVVSNLGHWVGLT